MADAGDGTLDPHRILRAARNQELSDGDLALVVADIRDLIWIGVDHPTGVETRRLEVLLSGLVEPLAKADPIAGVFLDWWLGAMVGTFQSLFYAYNVPDKLRAAIFVDSHPPDLATESKGARFDQALGELELMVDQVSRVSYVPARRLIQNVSNEELVPIIETLRKHEAPSDAEIERLERCYFDGLRGSNINESSKNWVAATNAVNERVELARSLAKRVASLRAQRECSRITEEQLDEFSGLANSEFQDLSRNLLAAIAVDPPTVYAHDLLARWNSAVAGVDDRDRFKLWWLAAPIFGLLVIEGVGSTLRDLCDFGHAVDAELSERADELASRAADGDDMREFVLMELDSGNLLEAREVIAEMVTSSAIEAARVRAKELLDRAEERGVTHQRINELRDLLAANDLDHLVEMVSRVEETAGMGDPRPVAPPAVVSPMPPPNIPESPPIPTHPGILRPTARRMTKALIEKPVAAYIIRVNAHNAEWNGTICTNPVRNTRCQSNETFKVDFCARGDARCSWISVFAEEPRVVLGYPFMEEYRPTIDFDPPMPGDLLIFWADTGGGSKAVGLWRLTTFSSATSFGWTGHGDPATAVMFEQNLLSTDSILKRCSQASRSRAIHYMDQSSLEAFLTETRDAYQDRLTSDPRCARDHAVIELLLDEQRSRVAPPEPEPEPELDGELEDIASHLPIGATASTRPIVAEPRATQFPVTAPKAAPTTPRGASLRTKLEESGVFYTDRQLERYLIAVREAMLVVIAGPSGVGKTRLVAEAAKAVGAEFELVAVRPDFRANENLIGYLPPFVNSTFSSTPAAQFIKAAWEEVVEARADARPPRPFHLCLDEMNLARPEHYLSELLSKMEIVDGAIRFHHGDETVGFPATITYPHNLVIIGTVNLDESTFPLTGKVLDRAAYLELDADRLTDFLGYATAGMELPAWISQLIIDIDAILDGARQGLGYRAAGRIVEWCREGADSDWNVDDAVDGALCALIWPRLAFGRADPSHLQSLETLTRRIREARGELPDSERILDRMLGELRATDLAFGQSRLS